MSSPRRVLVLGAAGRDFHDFAVALRDDPHVEVVAFTAAQIPGIAGRTYPAALAGPRYPSGIPIRDESELEQQVRDERIDEVVLSYSDLSHAAVMHLASRALAAGAGFRLLAPRQTMLRAARPVIAVTAVRTGCGKSQVARRVAAQVRASGRRPAVVRHPMPYGDLLAQRAQRFASISDLDEAGVTLEEREDYEPHILAGEVVHAGVDYAAVLRAAERDGEVIVWDGGNNDAPFFAPDLWITVVDPLRAGHELAYHPGETNFRAAQLVVVAKADEATANALAVLQDSLATANPRARVVYARSEVTADDPSRIAGQRVLLIEDGPTLTHGGMAHGAGHVAARKYGAAAVVDPRPAAVGHIAALFRDYPHLGPALPAAGYTPEQLRDLSETIRRVDCDAVVIATPADLGHVLRLTRPATRVRYELAHFGSPTLDDELAAFLSGLPPR